ncbi:hypothetical protein [Runella salmonicolor]|uniref:Uncharacterized protein n=1 Tax=Runella salmonicolor TaxID=2950278 RepID=A0ABT1FQP8_9BACT|nr:hypothetical protein [Runella salmonicolor]MCP1384026.1 hypothetical protein [Runella salmonicolor]
MIKLKKLLWIDAFAGLSVGVAVLLLKDLVQPYLQLPSSLLASCAVIALCYSVYAFHLVLRKAQSARWVQTLIYANGAYAVFCLGLLWFFFDKASWLGRGYLLLDSVGVGALALVEWKVFSQWFKN